MCFEIQLLVVPFASLSAAKKTDQRFSGICSFTLKKCCLFNTVLTTNTTATLTKHEPPFGFPEKKEPSYL